MLTNPSEKIFRPKQLAKILGVEYSTLLELVDDLMDPRRRRRYVHEFSIVDPKGLRKARDVISIRGTLKNVQRQIYNRVLLNRIKPSPSSHGGVHHRSIKSNAEAHLGNLFFYKTDIANFFPSINADRVSRFYEDRVCNRDVSTLLTQLTTLDGHLALGLVTSPILAEAVVQPVDKRISQACQEIGLSYTRFVDDICISGSFSLEKSGVPNLVTRILNENGFDIRPEKTICMSASSDLLVTGVEIRKGRLRVPPSYIQKLIKDLDAAYSLANDLDYESEYYYTKDQLKGRIQFVQWVNKGQSNELIKKFRRISWRRHASESQRRGLMVLRSEFRDREAMN